MQKKTKYADIHADFARKELIDGRTTHDSMWMNRAENRPIFAHHVVKPPAIDGLVLTYKVSATARSYRFTEDARAISHTWLASSLPENPASFFLWPHAVEERRQHGACGQ